jgi:hypothetical protein
MGLSPAVDPDDLVPIRAQVTKAQWDYLLREKRRLQDRSIAPALRRAVQADMERAQQQGGAS